MHSQAPSPRPVSPLLQTGLLLLTVVFLLCGAANQIWATSSDFAHHYALIARISQLWALPHGVDPSLGEMNIYPHNSHVLAAVLGRLVSSPLLGMQLVTLLSILTVWSALAAILLSLPKRSGLAGAAVLVALLLLNRKSVALDIFGFEDMGNFFYAQLVAQSLMAAALLAALWMERRGVAALPRYLFLIGVAYVVTGTHLLPAAQLVCVLLAQIALEFWQFLRQRPARWLGRAALGLACMVAAVAVLALHPASEAMRQISQSDGSLTLHFLNTPASITWLALLVVVLSGLLVLTSDRLARRGAAAPLLALKYIGLFGLACAGLCLLQIVLLQLGQGSPYAIKKHVFALNSVFLVELALLPACLLRPHAGAGNDGIFYNYLLLPLLTVLAFEAVTYQHEFQSAATLVAMEHQMELQRDRMSPPTPGKYTYAIDLPGMSNVVNYMMTIGVYAAPRSANSLSVLTDQAFFEPDLVGTIITSAQSSFGQMQDCLRPGSTALLAVIDGQCAIEHRQQGHMLVGLRLIDGQPPCTMSGFYQPEPGGRWTDGKQASIACPLPVNGGKKLRTVTLDVHPFLSGEMTQRMRVSLNDGAAREFEFKSGQPVRSVVLDLPADGKPRLSVHLELPDAVSPRQLGLGADGRQLGVMLTSLKFE